MYLEHIRVLNELNILSITLRFLLALILGGLLGIEREQKRRPAGFRTYVIVCLGATLASITNVYLVQNLGAGDPARIPAQVISGIGFLGAGTILVTRSTHIKGLTTAAGLWCAATIGIAIGTGFYTGAIIGSVSIVFSLSLLSYVDTKFSSNNKYLVFYVEYTDAGFIRHLITYSKKENIILKDLEINGASNTNTMYATFTLKLANKSFRIPVLEAVSRIEGIIFIEEI